MTTLHGTSVTLRPATRTDIPTLAAIRAKPEVYRRWRGGDDMISAVESDLDYPETTSLVLERDNRVIGGIEWAEETEPDYRHASIDIYVDPAEHGNGFGADAVRTLARHLFTDQGHHRIEIDPAAENTAAIRCYQKVGFQPVGIMRRYERDAEGEWRDALLMDLLQQDLTD